jgi:GAF domain-containing protein
LLAQTRHSPGPVAAAAAFVGIVAFVVGLATGTPALLAALVALPLAAATFASRFATAAVAAVTLVLTLLGGPVAGDAWSQVHVSALIAVAVAGTIAVLLAAQRSEGQRAEEFAAYLGDAGTLLACSLDLDATAKAAAGLPVPTLADWSLVEIVSPEGDIERRAASHANPEAEAVAADVPEGVHAVRGRSAIRVALRTVERRLGTMVLLSHEGGRRFGPEDLRRAEELALRCALAIENAQLYRAARRGGAGRFTRSSETPAPRPATD